MYKSIQYGRSMIEMLGVLAIIGVLSVGGLSVIAKAKRDSDISKVMENTAHLVMTSKKLACQYDSEYGTYTMMLYKSEIYPPSLTYDKLANTFVDSVNNKYAITSNESNATFTVTISNLKSEACIKLATSEWGNSHSNGFSKICIGNNCATSFEIDEASSKCADNSTVKLTYNACKK